VFVVAALVNAAFLPLFARVMPKLPARHELSYAEAMRSLWTLYRTQPLLRESCVVGALFFAGFSCFWTTLAFLLSSRYGLGAGVAGSFGLVGACGATVAPIAGRLADRHGARWVMSLGLAGIALSFAVFWAGVEVHAPPAVHMAALVLGVILLDVGAQLAQVANQTRIFGLVPSARSRLNTVYMTIYFSGAAVGSAMSTVAWAHWRWNGVCTLALGFIGLARLRHAMGAKAREPFNPDSRGEHPLEEAVLEA